MAELKLSLQENAFNFLNHSLSQAIVAEETPENWKYAVLHLVQAIELSLKELLRKEHPILIYKNIDKPGDTVSLHLGVKRLENISKIIFNQEDLKSIDLASSYRNQIVHYEFSFKIEEIKSIYAKLLGFLQSFVNKYFEKSLDDIVKEELWREALNIIEYSDELQKRADDRFREEGIDVKLILECRSCHQWAFVVQDEIDTCYVCGEKDESGICQCCGEIFYKDELYPLQYDDDQYCEECRNYIIEKYDDEARYYSQM